MSVLVESPSLIVRRAALDVRYAGGMQGFLREMELPEHRALRTCADSQLVCVSFLLAMHARRVAEKLEALGLRHIVDDRCVELVIVGADGEARGLCEWMKVEKHTAGFIHAWLATSDHGELSAPQGWDHERAVRAHPDTFGDEWGNCARITNEDGLETWLDYRTGEMETRASTGASVSVAPCESPRAIVNTEPLMPVVLGALAAANIAFIRSEGTSVAFGGHRISGFYFHRMFVDEQERAITSYCTLGTHVPEAQRPAVEELLLRLNERTSEHMLILDGSTGWVTALTHQRIENPVCGTSDIVSIWNGISDFASAHCAPVMRVAFGGMSPYENATWSPDRP
ncbi:MAG: hypothetical protein H0U66_16485 [Gemmatimonadaceae bacterium]|nr:hypothetical protein [Gemmatimonadaceae bacterium]